MILRETFDGLVYIFSLCMITILRFLIESEAKIKIKSALLNWKHWDCMLFTLYVCYTIISQNNASRNLKKSTIDLENGKNRNYKESNIFFL